MSSGDDDPAPPSDARAGMLASDRDRDSALALLSAAAGDGRLTLEEYSTRSEHALRARLRDELSELTGDLDAPSDQPAFGPGQMRAILGNESRKGYWRVPSHLAARSLLGDCHIELQDALLTSQVTTIEARATLGTITIFVPEGIEVRLSGTAILGATSSRVRSEPRPGAPVIEIRATATLGSVTVRPETRWERRIREWALKRTSAPKRLGAG
jgi:Domain of unknown function (DUF1707)/Cell wall-active antibiotics response 4TMS YvqF